MFQPSLDDILRPQTKGRIRLRSSVSIIEKREPHELLDECLCVWQFMEVECEDQESKGRRVHAVHQRESLLHDKAGD